MDGEQIAQIIGSLLILVAFILLQTKHMKATSTSYLLINFIGAGILAVTAIMTVQWGFIILEGVWSLVALGGLIQKATQKVKA